MIKEGDALFYTKVKVYTEDEIIKTKIIVAFYTGSYSNLIKKTIFRFRKILHENTYELNINSYD